MKNSRIGAVVLKGFAQIYISPDRHRGIGHCDAFPELGESPSSESVKRGKARSCLPEVLCPAHMGSLVLHSCLEAGLSTSVDPGLDLLKKKKKRHARKVCIW